MSSFSSDNRGDQTWKNRKFQKKLGSAGLPIGLGALLHPIQHVKVLIQLGHEPLPLRRGKSYWFFGAETFYLPNGLEMAKHIYRNDGVTGLYRGVTSCVCGNFVGLYASLKAKEYIDESYPDFNEEEAGPLKRLFQKTAKESAVKCAAVVAARPFQVVMIRAIAQSIGGETDYTRVLIGLSNADKQGGLKGLFAGLFPQLLYEMFTMWTSAMIIHAVGVLWDKMAKSNLVEEEEDEETYTGDEAASTKNGIAKRVIPAAVHYLVNSFFYPLQLVGTVMAVNGCGLAAGMEPHSPVFLSWSDCCDYLMSRQQIKRGSKLFFRFYNGPMSWRMGHTYASVKHLDIQRD